LQWLWPKVIQDEQIRAQVGRETAFPRTLCPAAILVLEHLLRVAEQHIQPLPGCFLAQRLR
jgi:hypothetical protein